MYWYVDGKAERGVIPTIKGTPEKDKCSKFHLEQKRNGRFRIHYNEHNSNVTMRLAVLRSKLPKTDIIVAKAAKDLRI